MIDIEEQWEIDFLSEEFKGAKSNRSSQMGHECIRFLYYMRMNPEEFAPFDLEAKGRMWEGKVQEQRIRAWLTQKYDVIRSQEEFGFNTLNNREPFDTLELSGHVEGFLVNYDPQNTLFEIKTCERYRFDTLHTIDNFYDNMYWLGYLKQATCYMKAVGANKILFIIKDRSSSRPLKRFWYEFSEEMWGGIISKCNTVNHFMELGTVPDAEHCDFSECDNCHFLNFCCPNRVIVHEGYKIVTDDDEIDRAVRCMDLNENEKSYIIPKGSVINGEELNQDLVVVDSKELKKLKEYFKRKYEGIDGIFFGESLEVTGKYNNRGETKYWKQNWRRL